MPVSVRPSVRKRRDGASALRRPTVRLRRGYRRTVHVKVRIVRCRQAERALDYDDANTHGRANGEHLHRTPVQPRGDAQPDSRPRCVDVVRSASCQYRRVAVPRARDRVQRTGVPDGRSQAVRHVAVGDAVADVCERPLRHRHTQPHAGQRHPRRRYTPEGAQTSAGGTLTWRAHLTCAK